LHDAKRNPGGLGEAGATDGGGNRLVVATTATKQITEFTVLTAEASGGLIRFEAPHTSDPPLYAAVVLLGRPTPTALLAPVRTGDSTLQAQLDTGASLSLIGIKGAARLGITPDLLARDAPGSARGIGRLTLALRNHIVPSLRLGSVEFRDVPLAFRTPAGGLPFDMLLGADLLGQQRVFISYATDRLLIAVPPRWATPWSIASLMPPRNCQVCVFAPIDDPPRRSPT